MTALALGLCIGQVRAAQRSCPAVRLARLIRRSRRERRKNSHTFRRSEFYRRSALAVVVS